MSADQAMAYAEVAGRRAAEAGQTHNANPHGAVINPPLHNAWFRAWFIATVEREEQCKLQVNAPHPADLP